MADIANLGIRVDSRQVRQGADDLDNFARRGARAEVSVNSLTGVVKSLGAGLAGLALIVKAIDFGSEVIRAQREFDKLNSSLITATGSVGNAQQAFAALQRFAASTPYDLQQVSKAFIQLRNLGLEPSERALTSYGNTAAAMGKDLSQLVEAVADAATGEFERLKEFGIKAKQNGDQVALTFQGTTTTVANSSKAIEEYLIRLGETKFAGGMELQAKTLDGAISALGDTWEMTLLAFAQTGFGDAVLSATLGLSGALTDLQAILVAVFGAADAEKRKIEEMGPVHKALTTIFETIAVVGANVAYVFTTIGKDIGAFAAAVMAAAQGDFKLMLQIATQRKQDSERERQEIDSRTAAILGAAESARTVREKEAKEKAAANRDDLARYAIQTQAVTQQTDAQKKAAKERAAAAKEAATWYQHTTEAGREEVALLRAELDAVGELTPAQREAVKIRVEMAKHAGLLAPKQKAVISGLIDEREELERVNAEREHYAELMRDQGAANAAAIAAANDRTKSLEEQVRYYGLTEAAVLRLQAAELARQMQAASGNPLEMDRLFQLHAATEDQIALQEKLTKMKANTAFWDSLESTAHQTFVSIADGGKGAATRLKDSFKNVFFDWLYQQTLKKWIINVGTSLSGTAGVSGIAGAAESGGSSAIGSGLSSAVSGLFGAGGLSGSLMAGAGWMTGATTFGGALGAGASLMGTGTLAGMASGLGVMAGALGPIALGVAGVMALVKKWDDSGTIHTGGAASASAAGVSNVSASTLNFQRINTADATNQMTAQLASSIVNILDSTATAFGKTAGYTAATAFADDTSKDGAWGALVIKSLDKTLVNWQDTRTSRWAPKEFADGDAGQAQYLAALGTSVRSALDSIGLPGWATSMLNELGNAPSLEQLASTIDAINATQAALVTMGQRLVGFAGMSDAAVSALISASGGINALATNASGYYDAFYTEGEKVVSVSAQIAQALQQVGIQMPATREEYRAQVEAQMKLGESGASAVAVLLAMSGSFAQIVPATEAAAAAINDLAAQQQAAAEAAEKAARIATERRGLEIQLMELTGNTAGALAATRFDELAALDPTNRALKELIYARQDEIAAAERAAEAAAQAAADAEAAAQEQAAIAATSRQQEIQLMQLTGDAAGALAAQRADELAAMDPSNRARQQLIYQLQDEAAAAAAAAKALADNETALRGFVSAAMSGVTRAINAQKSAVQAAYEETMAALQLRIDGVSDSVARLSDLSSVLRGGLDSMSMAGMEDANRANAQAQIEAALAIARAGGALPTADSIRDAVSMASQTSTDGFASFLDYQRDFVRTSAALSELAGLADGQLTDAQKQLKALDDQSTMLKDANAAELARLDAMLLAAQAQVDAINGVDNSVLSVAAAIAMLNASIAGLKAGATTSNPGGAGLTVDGLYQSVLGRSGDAGGLSFWTQAFGDSVDQAEMADFIKAAAPELAAKQGGTWHEWLRGQGVPGYAAGGSHGGGWRVVGENGPELENTGPSRIYSNGASSDLFAGVEARLQSLETTMATGLSRLIGETKRGSDAVESMNDKGVATRDETEIA